MAYYENKTTGKRSWHPKSGIGESLNSIEIGEDGKPLVADEAPAKKPARSPKPKVRLGASKKEVAAAAKALTPQTPEATTGNGSANPEGAH